MGGRTRRNHPPARGRAGQSAVHGLDRVGGNAPAPCPTSCVTVHPNHIQQELTQHSTIQCVVFEALFIPPKTYFEWQPGRSKVGGWSARGVNLPAKAEVLTCRWPAASCCHSRNPGRCRGAGTRMQRHQQAVHPLCVGQQQQQPLRSTSTWCDMTEAGRSPSADGCMFDVSRLSTVDEVLLLGAATWGAPM